MSLSMWLQCRGQLYMQHQQSAASHHLPRNIHGHGTLEESFVLSCISVKLAPLCFIDDAQNEEHIQLHDKFEIS